MPGCCLQFLFIDLIFLNTLIYSAANWRFAAKQFVKRYPEELVVHCEYSKSSTFYCAI